MTKMLLAAAAVALTLSACGGQPGGNAAAPADAEQQRGANSQARSVAFKTLGGDMKEIGDIMKGATAYDVGSFKAKAATFVEHANAAFQHFAKDTTGTDGFSRPEVWSNPEGFKAEEDRFLQAVNKVNEAAQAGNLEQIKAAFGEAGASCKSCHDGFKISTK